MKKTTLICMSLIVALNLAACGSDTGNDSSQNNNSIDSSQNNVSTEEAEAIAVTPVEIEQQLADAIGQDNYHCDVTVSEDYLQNTVGLDLSRVDSYIAKQNSINSVYPDTVIILKVRDGYADEAVNTLNTSYAQLVDYVRQYPFSTAKVLNARLYQSDNYVMYIIAGANYDGEDSEAENELAVSEYQKVDEAVKGILGTLPENLIIIPEDDGSAGGLTAPDDNNSGIPMPSAK